MLVNSKVPSFFPISSSEEHNDVFVDANHGCFGVMGSYLCVYEIIMFLVHLFEFLINLLNRECRLSSILNQECSHEVNRLSIS